MAALWEQIKDMVLNVVTSAQVSDIIDILLVAFIVYELLVLTKETRGSAVIKGLLILLLISWLSNLLGLTALNWILKTLLNNGVLLLVILFQPELRRALEQIGSRIKLHGKATGTTEGNRIVEEIVSCLTRLSRRRVGALIVFEQKVGMKDVIETGTALEARISAPLLENIFEPNTPLHDGAVVIRDETVKAAACILTLSEDNGISRDLGTRHRAGLGISENTDALVLIVSEETGIISAAKGGKLYRHLDGDAIRKLLAPIYLQQESVLGGLMPSFLRKKEGGSGNE